MHLSVTSVRNIECRFCAYGHDHARADFVDVASVARNNLYLVGRNLRE